jgi:hypothetical protein
MTVARSSELAMRHCTTVLDIIHDRSHKLKGGKAHWQRFPKSPPPSHSRNKIAMLSVMSIRRNRLKYPTIAVNEASVTASETAWLLRCFRRNAATCRLNFITKAPYRPCGECEQTHRGSKRDIHSEYAQDNEENDLKKVPIAVIGNLEQDQLSSTERVHSLCERC